MEKKRYHFQSISVFKQPPHQKKKEKATHSLQTRLTQTHKHTHRGCTSAADVTLFFMIYVAATQLKLKV